MIVCRLCGLTIDAIPEDSIQCGKLYRFSNGEYHYLRKKPEPRTGPRPRKSTNPTNPDREAPITMPSTPRGTHAHEVPEHVEPVEPSIPLVVEVDEAPVGETALGRAFRLSKLVGENEVAA